MPDKPTAVQLAEAQDERARIGAILANLRRERDQLVLDLGNMRGIAQGNKRHVATLSVLLERVSTTVDKLQQEGLATIHAEELRQAIDAPLRQADCPHLADVLAGRTKSSHDDSTCGWCANIRSGTAPVPGSSRRAQEPELRVCHGEDHGDEDGERIRYCCSDEYEIQPDGAAVHRDDVARYVPQVRHIHAMHVDAGESQASEPAATAERLAATEPTEPVKIRGIRVYRPDERRCADPDRPVRIEVAGVAYVDLTDADAHQVAALLVGVADWQLPAAPKLTQGGVVRPIDLDDRARRG